MKAVLDAVSSIGYSSNDVLYDMLSSAAAEEALAFYQYRVVAPFIEDSKVRERFESIAKDELEDHFYKLLDKLKEKGYDIELIASPERIASLDIAEYRTPVPPYNSLTLIDQNIESELDAIGHYKAISEYLKSIGDSDTLSMINDIIKDEEEHYRILTGLRDSI